jgi:hypothetical protein
MTVSFITICFVIYLVYVPVYTMGNKRTHTASQNFCLCDRVGGGLVMFTKVVLSLCPGPPEFWRGPIKILIGRKPIHCGPPLYNCPTPKGSGIGVWTKGNLKEQLVLQKIYILILILASYMAGHKPIKSSQGTPLTSMHGHPQEVVIVEPKLLPK